MPLIVARLRVINIGSIDGINTPYYENYSYSVAKAAVHKLTKVILLLNLLRII